MPGIVGLVTKMPRERAQAELGRMVEALRHESFYETGTWVDEQLGGLRRVGRAEEFLCRWDALVERTRRQDAGVCGGRISRTWDCARSEGTGPDAHAGRAVVSGSSQRRRPGVSGGAQREVSRTPDRPDPAYDVHCLTIGTGCSGFTIARPRTLSISRRKPKRFWKCIRNCGRRRAGDRRTRRLWVCVGESDDFRGIHVLPPGSAWEFQNGALEGKGSYFNPREWEDQGALEPEAYYQELHEVFSQNLPRYFNGRERVGVSLTGGLDTRDDGLVEAVPGALPCYSFGGLYRDCQDVVVARNGSGLWATLSGNFCGWRIPPRFSNYAERAVFLTDGCTAVNRSADLTSTRAPANCSRQNDGELRGRGSSARTGIQARNAKSRSVPSRANLAR